MKNLDNTKECCWTFVWESCQQDVYREPKKRGHCFWRCSNHRWEPTKTICLLSTCPSGRTTLLAPFVQYEEVRETVKPHENGLVGNISIISTFYNVMHCECTTGLNW